MSAADVDLIVSGAVEIAGIGCGTALCWKLLDRLRIVAPPKEPAPVPDPPGQPVQDGMPS